ncbi:hypothetical protein BT93_B1450 [Corymbia citriodora subsp. variegata]|nr:hypothetical protein BT93_B1450 [Corymbia citriodora subsp. variegata]
MKIRIKGLLRLPLVLRCTGFFCTREMRTDVLGLLWKISGVRSCLRRIGALQIGA